MDWSKLFNEENSLIYMGFKKESFTYQTGGGEDENDMDVFIKGNMVVSFDHTRRLWMSTKWDMCNYINGWYESGQDVFNIDDYDSSGNLRPDEYKWKEV